MARTQGKKWLIVSIAIVAVVLLSSGAIVLVRNAQTQKTSPTTSSDKTDTTKTTPSVTPDSTDTTKSAAPAVDPSTLSSIDVTPLGVSVFYTKGTPGFGFTVKKTANQTQYAEFTSTDLVGTKCTNDEGLFVSVIKNPTSSEDLATISQTVKVGNDTFGLSLTGQGCTGNADLLAKYQTAFTNGFSSLKGL